MTEKEYGTVDHYSEMSADILADCASGDQARDEKTIRNIMAGSSVLSQLARHHDGLPATASCTAVF